MAQRPKVFALEVIQSALWEQGVPEGSIGPTISFMRYVIPLAILELGETGIVNASAKAVNEWGLKETPSWDAKMAPYIVKWPQACLDQYEADLARRAQNQGG
jgi:hypothetical protein